MLSIILLLSAACMAEEHPVRIKLGPDETYAVKAAVQELADGVRRRTGVTMAYSAWSSPSAGDLFVSTQPWAVKGAWFVKEKNGILAVHGSDFDGTAAAVRALAARYAASEDGKLIRGKTDYTMSFGVQRDAVFDDELARVAESRVGAEDWENELVTERNRELARAYSFPLERIEDALVPGLPKTRYVKSLDGVWRFSWCGRPAERPRDFFLVDFDDSDWFEMNVPACVECHGFGRPIFTNVPYYNLKDPPKTDPDDNPVSSYRTTFEVPADWHGRRVHLRFEGVASAFNVWLNGRKVGYGEDTMLPSEFDITPFLNGRGEANLLAVEVFRWSDGSYLEDQDRFEFSGIHRGVSVWAEPMGCIRDFAVKTTPADADGNWVLEVKAECAGLDGVSASLYDANFKKVGEFSVGAGGKAGRMTLSGPRLWSAEDPYLYTLVLAGGSDVRSCKVGFRDIVLAPSGALLVNGRPVKMRGVNWREFSATEGFTVTEAEMEADVRMLKRANFNCVRTAHNPAHPLFYHLCDRYGIYVQSEANVESHGMRYGVRSLAYPPSWAKSQVERGVRMVRNYRNFPCVFQWSLGNEAGTGPNFELMRDAMQAEDSTRLFINRNDNENFAIHGHGYLTLQELERAAAWGPFFMSEYAHAMGNSVGNFKEYWDVIYRHDALQGGCIWDWIDQVVPVKTDRLDDAGRRIVYGGYGGDWDEGAHCAAGCVNGLIGPERAPTAKLAEVAHVQRPLAVSCADASQGVAELENRNSFLFADAYEGAWELFEDGVRVDGGPLDVPRLEPLASGQIQLPSPTRLSNAAGVERFYRVSFRLKEDCLWAERGWEVAHDQLPFAPGPAAPPEPGEAQGPAVAVGENGDGSLSVAFGRSRAVFSRQTGTLSSLEMDGKAIFRDRDGVCCGPRLTCMRAYRDGDLWLKSELMKAGVTRLSYHPRPAKVARLEDGTVEILSRVAIVGGRGRVFDHEARYAFRRDGVLEIDNVSEPHGKLPQLMRLGLACQLDGRLENVSYYGRGPWENYVDRNTASDVAIWTTTVSDMYESYVRPQECGSRTDVRWAAFLDADGDGVLVKASVPMSFSSLHYGWEELSLARHVDANGERRFAPLLPRREIVASFDIHQLGLGNAQCGPKPLKCYTFPNRREQWKLTFVPVASADADALRRAARRVRQDAGANRDDSVDLTVSGKGYDGG